MPKNNDSPIKDALLLAEDKKKALLLPTDEDIMNTFILKKGNISSTARELNTSTRYINSRIAVNPEIAQARELGRVSTVDNLYDMIVAAVQTGYISYYTLGPNGETLEEKVKIETGTRMFHMMKIIDINKSRIGIVKELPKPTVNNFVQVNVLSSEKLQQIEDILSEETQ